MDEADAGERLQAFARKFTDTWGARSADPQDLVDFVAEAVPHTLGTGLTLVKEDGRPTTLAATGALPEQVDAIEYECGEGPCLDALERDDLSCTNDLTTETRWPTFAERVVRETPVRSMFGARVYLADNSRGALNFYSREVGAFTELDLGIGAMMSTLASQALRNAVEQRKSANLEIALESSRQIGTAIGILMSRQLLTAEQAFEQLRQASQVLHRKVRDVALEVMDTGTLPDLPSAQRRRG